MVREEIWLKGIDDDHLKANCEIPNLPKGTVKLRISLAFVYGPSSNWKCGVGADWKKVKAKVRADMAKLRFSQVGTENMFRRDDHSSIGCYWDFSDGGHATTLSSNTIGRARHFYKILCARLCAREVCELARKIGLCVLRVAFRVLR